VAALESGVIVALQYDSVVTAFIFLPAAVTVVEAILQIFHAVMFLS